MAVDKSKHFIKAAAALTLLFIFLFSNATETLALNKNYVIDELHGWTDVPVAHYYYKNDDGFDGILKSIVDEENGCYYIYFSYYDKRLSNANKENITLTFTVKNSKNSYKFSVKSDGFTSDTGDNDINAVELAYNFDTKELSGAIFIGFELTNSVDRTLVNYISCEYSAGVDKTTTLFKNAVLDMYVPEETTTNKSSKTTTTKKSTTTTKKSNTTDKSGKSSNSGSSKTTKYTPTGTTGTTEYPAEENDSDSATQDGTEYSGEQSTDATYEEQDGEYEMSPMSVALLVIGILIGIAAIIILTICVADSIFKKRSSTQNDDDINDFEE